VAGLSARIWCAGFCVQGSVAGLDVQGFVSGLSALGFGAQRVVAEFGVRVRAATRDTMTPHSGVLAFCRC
jgi:hypothetical protein